MARTEISVWLDAREWLDVAAWIVSLDRVGDGDEPLSSDTLRTFGGQGAEAFAWATAEAERRGLPATHVTVFGYRVPLSR